MEREKNLEENSYVCADLDVSSSNRLTNTDRTAWFHLKTLFLFTKSDFKTVIFPQSIFALSIVLSHPKTESVVYNPNATLNWRLPCMLIWIWIHLLVENISNQRLPGSVVEDAANKPWRPIPAGRLTPSEAQILLRIAVPVAMGVSRILGSFEASVTLMTLIWLYNDLGGSGSGPWQRNVLNAAGLSCFGWGAVSVLLGGDDLLNNLLCKWLILLAAVITTTVHAQDFPDVDGDSACGRRTMPLLYGQVWSRYGLAVSLVFWSIVCLTFWDVSSPVVWSATLLIGGMTAGLTAFHWDPFYDRIVWRLWCLWISVLYLLPLVGRVHV